MTYCQYVYRKAETRHLNPMTNNCNVSQGTFLLSPPPPHQKIEFNSEGKKKADCLIVKERKTFAPGMHISILKKRKRLIV